MIAASQPVAVSILPILLLVLAMLAFYIWARRSPKPAPRRVAHPVWRWLGFALGLFLLGLMIHKQIKRPVESTAELAELGTLHRPDPQRQACHGKDAERLLLQSFIYSKAHGRIVAAQEKLLEREDLQDWTRLRCEWHGHSTKLALIEDGFNSQLTLARGGGSGGGGIWAYDPLAWKKQTQNT
ncbi:MAG: hypothetical protein RL095_1720 [Verrucomicrobiota bacterium]|jgi:hypothetical protein